jgi:hypothetical protein
MDLDDAENGPGGPFTAWRPKAKSDWYRCLPAGDAGAAVETDRAGSRPRPEISD